MILHNPILHSSGIRGVCGTIRTKAVLRSGRTPSYSRNHGQAFKLSPSRNSIKVLDDFASNTVRSIYIQSTQQAAHSNNNSQSHFDLSLASSKVHPHLYNTFV